MPGDTDRDHGHRAVQRDVQLRKRAGEIGAAVGDGRGARVVRVMHHDPADVLEISMAATSPTGKLDERDPSARSTSASQTGSPVHRPVWGTA
jgi:hypothetical protein